MARVTDKGISGAVGNFVFFTFNGKSFVKSKPVRKKKKKGAPVDPVNAEFGKLSRFGSPMIKIIKPHLLFSFNQASYNAARSWMGNLYKLHKDDATWPLVNNGINTAQLNAESDIRNCMEQLPQISDLGGSEVSFSLPAMNPVLQLRAPANTEQIRFKFFVTGSSFHLPNPVCYYQLEIMEMDYNNQEYPSKQQIVKLSDEEIPVNGYIVLAGMAIEYRLRGSEQYLADKRWLPVGLLGMGKLK
jgi:hypothetical protein